MDQISSDRELVPGALVAGKLRVLRLLGTGGMGSVYEVQHEITHHRRALKLLHAQMAQVASVVERFLREASAAGRIGSPHIVETFDAGRLETGEPYIVMELLHGTTLADVLNQGGPLDPDTAIDVLVQACEATAAAHAVGIVHRDLKPENLFLCGSSGTFVKVLDFGISKFDANATGVEGLTLEGSPLGTPYYMSPEQVQGERTLDGRTDVYALGVVLYECLTGRKPFVAETLPHLVVLIFQGSYTPASELRLGLSQAFDAIVAKAMARERNDRFATPQEFASELARLRSTLAQRSHADSSMHGTRGENLRAQLPASTPALTPDVFSRPAWREARPIRLRSNRHRSWVAMAGIIVGIAFAALCYRTWWTGTRQRIDVYAVSPGTTQLPAPSIALSSASAPIGSSAQEIAVPRDTPNAPPASGSPSALSTMGMSSKRGVDRTTPATNPSAALRKENRASSFGLTESNPFQ